MEKRIEQIASKRGYVVTEDGALLNPNGIVKGLSVDGNGYHQVSLRFKGVNYKTYIHRLQAYQKYGDKLFEDGVIVRHLDNIKTNNSWDNILIGTQSDNMMDVPEQIRIKKALHASSFIKKYNKKEVQDFHKKCKSYKETMDEFGITSKGTLHYILNN